MLGLKPTQASDFGRYQLIDIRPALERYSGMGFVAGSICLPRSNELDTDATTLQRITGGKIPVLVCLTGHRAHGLALALAQTVELPLGYLDGGLFAWNAEGLPLAGLRLVDEPHAPLSAAEFETMLHTRLSALLTTQPVDTREPVERVLERCMLSAERPLRCYGSHELRTLLDMLAVVLLELGVPRRPISDLLDQLVSRLPSAWHQDARVR